MNIKEAVSKIKAFLTEETEQPTNLIDIKTKDGIILSYEGELGVGIEIFVVDESGRNPAPDGEYILEDGTKLMVAGGKIEEMEAPEAPIEAPEEMPVVEEEMEEEAPTTLSVEELASKIAKLESDYAQMMEVVTQLAQSFSESNFKKEVKASMETEVQPEIKLGKMIEKPLNKNKELNNIFKNMYNKKLY